MMLAPDLPATGTCPHCADDLDRDRCATCSGTGRVDVCCTDAEAEPVCPVVDADDYTIVCPVHARIAAR